MNQCSVCFTQNEPGAHACMLCQTALTPAAAQQPLFTEPTATNSYPPEWQPGVVIDVRVSPEVADAIKAMDEADTARMVVTLQDESFIAGVCADVRAATDTPPVQPLDWDDCTAWIPGESIPHYIGWYDVQMRSRLNDEQPAEGITRFWFAGRDWYTGPKAIEHGAPCVPRGNVFHWRGRAKP